MFDIRVGDHCHPDDVLDFLVESYIGDDKAVWLEWDLVSNSYNIKTFVGRVYKGDKKIAEIYFKIKSESDDGEQVWKVIKVANSKDIFDVDFF